MSCLLLTASSPAWLAFEPELLSGVDCAALAEELAATEKACAAARLLASARAVACGAHKEPGFNDGAAWMARQVGGTTGQARQALETAAGLADCPGTRLALLAGELSLTASRRDSQDRVRGARCRSRAARNCTELGPRPTARQSPRAPPSKYRCNELHRQQLQRTAFPPLARQARHGLLYGCSSSRDGSALHQPPRAGGARATAAVHQSGGERERFEAYAADALAAMASRRRPGSLVAGGPGHRL